jgi:hypothetical protein
MPICLILQFPGGDVRSYDKVTERLGLNDPAAKWPKGIISHVAGMTREGLCVVDVWESQQDFDAYLNERLKPAFDAAGGIPQPRVTRFEVHNRYPR